MFNHCIYYKKMFPFLRTTNKKKLIRLRASDMSTAQQMKAGRQRMNEK